ncbi:fumarylacetoacetate hydrolase [Klebsiella pneumoniae]|nr:fumarylacetoacetate hydrolase [Klebsiella pneumoniae]
MILTGTPEGVGPLHSGDELEVGFNGLTLTTRVL